MSGLGGKQTLLRFHSSLDLKKPDELAAAAESYCLPAGTSEAATDARALDCFPTADVDTASKP